MKLLRVHLNRALSKLGILTRSQATTAILDGRVKVNGRVVRNPAAPIDLEHARIEIDGQVKSRTSWRTILFHKPRGVMTTNRDPEGRPTIYDILGQTARGLVPIGRLDFATSGLLLLTTDTALAASLTDPRNHVSRIYVATVRGRVSDPDVTTLTDGLFDGTERLRAESVSLRKVSGRESHVIIELKEGKNREVRRLFEAIGHEVTRLKRVAFGGLELGDLAPGEWREVDEKEIRTTIPAASSTADIDAPASRLRGNKKSDKAPKHS